MILTLLECQLSPCFRCRNMSTELLEWSAGHLDPVRIKTSCLENHPEFPKARCDFYTEEKKHED